MTTKIKRMELRNVHYMPKVLVPGILYVSEEFHTAAHLCACGCGAKIRTPLGPTEWAMKVTPTGPSLWPSVGNWQRACRSHYVVDHGSIIWRGQWTPEQIVAGQHLEQVRRHVHYAIPSGQNSGIFGRFLNWVKQLFN